jgi:replicative DNA helicase
MLEKMLPQNVEAEIGFLGGILIDPHCFDQVVDLVRPEDFYHNAHRVIFSAYLTLYRRKITPDLISLTDELSRIGKLDEIGGPVTLSRLINQVPTSVNVAFYAGIVARTALNRRIIQVASDIAALAYHEEDESLEQAEKMIYDLRSRGNASLGFSSMKTVMNEYMDELGYLNTHKGQITGIPSGYVDLDMLLAGFQRSELILLAGRPSMGKTAAALCLAYNAAVRGKKVAIFSLEMGRKLLARRFMAMTSKVDMQRLRSGWIEEGEWEQITEAYINLSELPVFINDVAGSPVASMRAMLRRLTAEHGPMDMVVVDYVGLIDPDSEGEKRNNLVQQLDTISRGLKSLAKEFDVPVLALSQLSRGVESRQNKRPGLGDLRDSGSLEQNADVVMFIYRDDYYNQRDTTLKEKFVPDNIAELLIAKHRNGPIGDISLRFEPKHNMFYGISYGEE